MTDLRAMAIRDRERLARRGSDSDFRAHLAEKARMSPEMLRAYRAAFAADPAMMAALGKPTIPEVLDRFVAYHRIHSTWGSLHSVLADGNVSDGAVESCLYGAIGSDAEPLARLLLRMSRTQRLKLPSKVHEAEGRELTQLIAERAELVTRSRALDSTPRDVALAVPVYGYGA